MLKKILENHEKELLNLEETILFDECKKQYGKCKKSPQKTLK